MKKLILGIIIGALLSIALYYKFASIPVFQIEIGKLMDIDIIHLKNGNIIRGWIIRETPYEIAVKMERENAVIHPSDCETIEKNVFMNYVKKPL